MVSRTESYGNLLRWIAEQSSPEDYASKDILIEAISGADWRGTATGWIENEGYTSMGKRVYDRNIQTQIDDYNRNEIDIVRSEISGALSPDDIPSITRSEGEARFGRAGYAEISDLIASKLDEFESTEERIFEELFDGIGGATTDAQLDRLEDEVRSESITTRSESELLRQIDRTRRLISEEE